METTIEKVDMYGRNSTTLKRIRAENKQGKKNKDRDAHINLSNSGVPRRNKNGNKLGLRKRRLLAIQETNFPYDEIEFAKN